MHPAASDVLLAVLEEKVLELAVPGGADRYLRAALHLCAEFSGNSDEYGGFHGA